MSPPERQVRLLAHSLVPVACHILIVYFWCYSTVLIGRIVQHEHDSDGRSGVIHCRRT